MTGVARKKVRTKHQKPDAGTTGHGLPGGNRRKRRKPIGNASVKTRVIQAQFRVLNGVDRLESITKDLAGALRITIHQEGRHVHHVVFRTAKPVLQAKEIGTNVLGRARNEAKNFG